MVYAFLVLYKRTIIKKNGNKKSMKNLKIFFFGYLLKFSFLINAQTPTMGLMLNNQGSLDDGYVLFAPNSNKATFMINKCGDLVHSWNSNYLPGLSVYFLPDGSLMRTGYAGNTTFTAGGAGGVIQQIDWNSNLVWSYTVSNALKCQHHDIKVLPNGNILALVWEYKTKQEAVAVGRDSLLVGPAIWSESVLELQPVGTNSAIVVWEWHIWDHLVQDYDNSRPNYGTVSANPQLMNINYRAATGADWLHFNAIDYNPAFDQILISSRQQDEFYIIDHSTTSVEAASHAGGDRGKGGDFLYRWGNPYSYQMGSVVKHRLFGQHNVQWITSGLPNEGKIMIFNNGNGRTGGNYSSVDIIDPPVSQTGDYTQTLPFGPDSAEWSYHDPAPYSFYSPFISGAQQLSNGNVLVCNAGSFFELDSTKNKVWKYLNPVSTTTMTQGNTPTNYSTFRCTFYPDSYSGFNGHTLTAMGPIELNPVPNPIINTASTITIITDFNCMASGSSIPPFNN
jgi:hypothetical protein